MIKHVFTFVLLALVGCFGSDFRVRPDAGLSPAVHDAFVAAVADWQKHAPVRISLESGPCPYARVQGDLCPHRVEQPVNVPWEPGTLLGYTIHPDMWLADPLIQSAEPAERQWLIAHELGHEFGLLHDAPGTLMYPYFPGASPTVTAADVRQFCATRACPQEDP